ncbi:lysozyme g isoform X2 [Lates calcarifer]|uniref:Lysozyme g n=1 Tax=Lates calcarifer TaxID=8187 RepID=A0A4W6FNN7_LATCA|nr:lysozyme g isoform X2 [Lates calcarifer]
MSTKTVKSALRDMLEDLDEKQRKKFCAAILDRREEPRVRRAALENKDIVDITDALVTHFTESGAKEVALQTLREIGCNAQRESFAKDVGGGSLTGGGSVSSVKASHAMAESDLIEMNKYKSIINSAARKKGVDPALIAALISRSCRAGKTLAGGWGCYDEKRQKYNTFGLMQIDVNPNGGGHTPKGSWNSEEHLCQAIDILIYFIIRIKHTFPEWSKEQQLRGGIAAYNAGDENILSYEELDSITTGGDYSSDVIARAQWYKCNADF